MFKLDCGAKFTYFLEVLGRGFKVGPVAYNCRPQLGNPELLVITFTGLVRLQDEPFVIEARIWQDEQGSPTPQSLLERCSVVAGTFIVEGKWKA